MSDRTLFGHPIRAGTTGEFYPDKMTLAEFIKEMHASLDGFEANMRVLAKPGTEGGWWAGPQYIEVFAERFLAWCEIEEER